MSRIGNFSSSKMGMLMSKSTGKWTLKNVGKPFYTLIEDKMHERRSGKPIEKEHNAKATSWGKLVEEIAFDRMELDYSLVSKKRYYHELYSDYWSGMPDLETEEEVGDIKCPYTLKSFYKLTDSMKSLNSFKEKESDYYWQLVSNGILCKRDKALIVSYCPYEDELEEIKRLAEDKMSEKGGYRYAFILWALDDELPSLKRNYYYKNLNMFEFDIPKEDKEMLTARVEMAISELNRMLKK